MFAVKMVNVARGEIVQFLVNSSDDRLTHKIENFQDQKTDDWRIVIIEITTERSWEEIDNSLSKAYNNIDWSN